MDFNCICNNVILLQNQSHHMFEVIYLQYAIAVMCIPGQGPEGHLVLKLENEVGPPLQIQKTTLILTKIDVFDKKVLLFI